MAQGAAGWIGWIIQLIEKKFSQIKTDRRVIYEEQRLLIIRCKRNYWNAEDQSKHSGMCWTYFASTNCSHKFHPKFEQYLFIKPLKNVAFRQLKFGDLVDSWVVILIPY